MVTIVPPTLLNLAGLPGATSEPHIQPGNHLRVTHHPVLGLPVAPFILQRARLTDRLPDNFGPRRDIVFRDAQNRVLSLPITVQKGDEIRATIVQGASLSCIWVGMTSRSIDLSLREPIPVPRPISIPLSLPRRPDLDKLPRIDPRVLRNLLTDRLDPQRDAVSEAGDLRMRAYGPSVGQGPALVGERRVAPYTVGAPQIVELVVTGRGIITDMAWIAAQDVAEFNWETIDILNLPSKAGARYLSVTDARERSESKLRVQAPKRRPLQETLGAIVPGTAPNFTPTEESDRVHALADPLDGDLDVLINGPDLPLQAAEIITITDAVGNLLASGPGEDSSITILHLSRVLQATLDPGVAGWLGYKVLDQQLGAIEGLSLYRVIGFFRNPLAIGAQPEQLLGLPLNAIPQGDRQMTESAVFRTVIKLASHVLEIEGRQLLGELEAASDYMMMAAVAAVDGRAIPEPPSSPQMLTPEHISWLPAVPPAALREVECPVKGVLIGATLAAEREQPTTSFASLNRKAGNGPWHIPLTLGLTTVNDGLLLIGQDGRQGFIADRSVGPDAARHHIAQQDRFGRWSGFAQRDAAPGPRPKPPRPVVQGSYRQPALADATTSGGTFLLRVLLPEVASLAPGSFPLSHVRLSFRHHNTDTPAVEAMLPNLDAGVATAIVIETPPVGEAPHRAVPVTLTGPILQPVERRRMVITTVWIDTAGQQSVVSESLRLLMTDPRPPAQIPIPDILLYSSRPDATGLAWVERYWPAPTTNPPNYAVYYTDEIRLLSWLTSEGRTTEATEIAALTNRAARAGRFRAIQSDFPDFLFERLPGAVDDSAAGSRRFRHALSGASRILNAYKIAVEAPASGARPDLSGLDMVFYGIPNSDPPPRPRISVRLVRPLAGEPELVAEVTVTQETGVTRGEMVRIYRTRGGLTDPLQAPLITTLPLPTPDEQTGRQVLIFRDVGAAQIAPSARLSAFTRYQWLAEVQGAPESGSTVPGLWSRPSDPIGLVAVPLTAPATPSFDGFGGTAVTGGTQDLTLAFSHSLDLRPTTSGSWRLEIMRAPPGEPWSLMSVNEIREIPILVPDPSPDGFTTLATRFRVTLFDPLGRSAPALELISG